MAHTAAPRNGAVDALKGIAIVFVLIIHAAPRDLPFSSLWVRQAVPLFVVLMGYTGAFARVRPLPEYFKRRAVRLLVPWAVIWVISFAVGLMRGGLRLGMPLLGGALPIAGPGKYFITIAFSFVLILPLLRWLLDKGPWTLLVTCLLIDLCFELFANYFGISDFAFRATILQYLVALALGMMLARGHVFWWLAPVSLSYLVALTSGFRLPFLRPSWQSHFLLSAGYTAALVWMGLRVRWPRFLQAFGRASWHVYLLQILWFGRFARPLANLLELSTSAAVIVNIGACLLLGVVFAAGERRVFKAVRLWRQDVPIGSRTAPD